MTVDWLEPEEISVPDNLVKAVGGHPLVAKTLVRRGFAEVDRALAFIDPNRYAPTSPFDLPDMAAAVERVERAIQMGEVICVWGDFDVDGQTATTLLVSALRGLGARLSYHIPVRKRESHGVNIPVLSEILKGDSAIRLLLTCDTGVAAHEAVDYANARKVDVIITDHHELPEKLPQAHAVVNSNRLPGDHPQHTLPGVGVAYKLVEGLYQRAGRIEELAGFLDLVALGIVADVAEQVKDTRYLLQLGLAKLREPERLGLRVMMDVAEVRPEWLSEEHIGFVLGPRLNALGRLDDANQVVELLTTQDEERARMLAYHLEGLNRRRQLLTSQVYQAALAVIERDPSLVEFSVLVLAHPKWPAGVIGIVASKLVERFHKPAILIAAPEGGLGHASARSIDGVDITAAIAAQQDILEGFGGHAMAAGFAIQPDRIPEFRQRISYTVAALERPALTALSIDAYVPLSELSLDLVSDLERLAPYGAGNPPLVLASCDLEMGSYHKIGRNDEHLSLSVHDQNGSEQKVLWWGGADELDAAGLPQGRFDLAYTVRTSTFRGQRNVQVEWLGHRIQKDGGLTLASERRIEVIDYRAGKQQIALLDEFAGTYQIWAEGQALKELIDRGYPARSRQDLESGVDMVVWTAPPDRTTWAEVLGRIKPQQIILFGVASQTDTMESFLARLGGLVKYAIERKGGQVNLAVLAIAMAQNSATISAGLAWMQAAGHVTILETEQEVLHLGAGVRTERPDAEEVFDQLRARLEEARAFRAYFNRAGWDALLQLD